MTAKEAALEIIKLREEGKKASVIRKKRPDLAEGFKFLKDAGRNSALEPAAQEEPQAQPRGHGPAIVSLPSPKLHI